MTPILSDEALAAGRPLDIAVVGAGISGLSAAWLLSQRHRVTLYEREPRLGGHSHTVDAPSPEGPLPVDTGFIVYNERNYPNLTALFAHLGVATRPTDMSFGVSIDGGRLEYASHGLATLFAQKRNVFSPRYWGMLGDLVRFYREAPGHACGLEAGLTSLGDYLCQQGYGRAFQDDHLLPQAAAIWSASARDIREFPAAAFIRFCENHGLLRLKVSERPRWRTVVGGSRAYVRRLAAALDGGVRLAQGVRAVRRTASGPVVIDARGEASRHDRVVIAAHADQALAMLDQPGAAETEILGAFRYTPNRAVLHGDVSLMPRRRACWSAWNYVGRRGQAGALCVSYWMNALQGLPEHTPLFVTLNPVAEPRPETVVHEAIYEHPLFDAAALRAQRRLWTLQGAGGVWFCGAYFGSGFHEDGLQAGLAAAEAAGGVRRPWAVADASGRIHMGPPEAAEAGALAA